MGMSFINGRLLTPEGFRDDLCMSIDGERIERIDDQQERCYERPLTDLAGKLLLPGFIDVQVNGGGGLLFNDAPTVATIRRMADAHARHGTTGFLPTLISDDPGIVALALAAVDAAIASGVPGVLGIHVEGPFLNPARRGVHDAARLRTLDEAAAQLLCVPRRGVVLLTLAPETTTPAMIARLCAAGVIVSAGHTDATAEEFEAAAAAGLRGVTHLFNAMSPLTSRAPGVVGAALLDREVYCGFIADGKHVDPRSLRVALRARGLRRMMLVTDAMPPAGTDMKSFDLQGKRIRVLDGWCVDEQGTLAGTALDMNRCVRNAMTMLELTPQQAIEMASAVPAEFLRIDARQGRLLAGQRADFLICDSGYTVLETWIGGRRVA